MSSTNKTTYYNLSQYIGTDKPTYLGDYNSDMLAIDTAIHGAAEDASSAVSTASVANSIASTASSDASSALSTANNALETANTASNTATTASNNASAALTAAGAAETAAAANTITNLAPAYDATLTYAVNDLVTYIDEQGSGKLYKCIVAVGTPEAFNINKWDDVSTSEVYGKKKTILAQASSDGIKTFAELLNEIYNTITIDIEKRYELELIISSTTIATYNHRAVSASEINFTNVHATDTNLRVEEISISSNSTVKYCDITTGSTTFTDNSSAVLTNGRTLVLYTV